jgi:NADPH-dependent 2,4-dienoyl-CoA reductase/sulfur reductase-like enzyme
MKRIVIIGAGFGGLAAKALRHAKAELWVIDRANHNLFQPLLYQVTTTVLSPAQIASPIRELVKNQRNATVFLGGSSPQSPPDHDSEYDESPSVPDRQSSRSTWRDRRQ